MAIRVKCAGCGKTIKAGDDWAGKRGKCPACGNEFTVPHASTAVETKPAIVPSIVATSTAKPVALPPKRAELVIPHQARHAPIARPIAIQIPCPFCGEAILETAIKCRHCSEFLDGRHYIQQHAPQQIYVAPAAAPQVNVNVVQSVRVGGHYKRWSRLVAMILSFIIPGLGQVYKGQPINGLVWFVLTIAGYAFFIVPGIVLHICCILGAAMGDPYR